MIFYDQQLLFYQVYNQTLIITFYSMQRTISNNPLVMTRGLCSSYSKL